MTQSFRLRCFPAKQRSLLPAPRSPPGLAGGPVGCLVAGWMHVVNVVAEDLRRLVPIPEMATHAEEFAIPDLRQLISDATTTSCSCAEPVEPREAPAGHHLSRSLPTCALVAAFVALETARNVLVTWEVQEKAAAGGLRIRWLLALILLKSVTSLVGGVAVGFWHRGSDSLREAVHVGRALALAPVSALAVAAQACSLLALKDFDAGSVKVFAQLCVPATAALSWAVLGRRYSGAQWQAIIFLGLCSVAFIEVRILFEAGAQSPLELALGLEGRPHARRPAAELEGILSVLLAVLFSSTAFVLGEKLFPRRDARPCYVQKYASTLSEGLAALALLEFAAVFLDSHPGSGDSSTSLFPDIVLDRRTLLVVLVWSVHSWAAHALVRSVPPVFRSIAHILSAAASYTLAMLLWSRLPTALRAIPGALTAALVFLCVFIFATILPMKTGRSSKGRARSARVKLRAVLAFLQRLPAQGAALRSPQGPRASAPGGALAVSFAQSCCDGVCSSAAVLLTAFIILEATRPLLVSWAQQGSGTVQAFMNGTFVLGQTLVSFLVALLIARTCEGSSSRALRLCANPADILRLVPVSCCFTVSKLAVLAALAELDAGTVRVMAQGGLPMIAVGSSLLGQRYSKLQWQAIWMIGLGVVTFLIVKTEAEQQVLAGAEGRTWASESVTGHESSGPRVSKSMAFSVFCVFLSLGANCLGALVSERFLKRTITRVPYYAQKAHLLGGECVVNLGVCVGCCIACPWRSSVGMATYLSSGWDHRTIITMLIWIPSGWCATLVVRRCSVLSKNIAQSVSSLLTYLLSIFPITLVGPSLEAQPVIMPVFLLALVCIQSVLLFVVASAEEEERCAKLRKQRAPQQQQQQQPQGASPQASPATSRLPIVHAEVHSANQLDDPIGQLDFAGIYAPLATPGLQRVSTLGADLYGLANSMETKELKSVGLKRRFTPFDDYPIGQTDFNWIGHQQQ